eukprot:jgi/Mesen1/2519/ME000160S01631
MKMVGPMARYSMHAGQEQRLEFKLENCKLVLNRGDITKWSIDGHTDAIVNAANERMLGGGGVDGAIHRAAGPELRKACEEVGQVTWGVRCPTGEARITPAFRLPVAHVVHTVGPVYQSKRISEPLLASAYKNSIEVAEDNGVFYLCFPAISCGVHFVLFEAPAWNAWVSQARSHFGREGPGVSVTGDAGREVGKVPGVPAEADAPSDVDLGEVSGGAPSGASGTAALTGSDIEMADQEEGTLDGK